MNNEKNSLELTKHERRLVRKHEKEKARTHSGRARTVKHSLILAAFLGGGVGLLVWWAASQKPSLEGDVLTRDGFHWHPEITLVMQGQPKEIPANIGIGAVHNPIHTHDSSGVIHLEFEGLVTIDDVRLGQFFQVWNTPFSSTCILDKCNDPDGQVTMTVNGQPNTEYDRYVMQDKDKIEIRFE